jgi:hypothetical protein
LTFVLETIDGVPVKGGTDWLRATSSGFSTVRMQLQTYHIPQPGRYVLRIGGLGAPQARDAEHAVVFTKPHLADVIGNVLGVIAATALVTGSIVLFVLSLYFRAS